MAVTYAHKIMQKDDDLEIARSMSDEVSLRWRGYEVVQTLPVVYELRDLELTDEAITFLAQDDDSEFNDAVEELVGDSVDGIVSGKQDHSALDHDVAQSLAGASETRTAVDARVATVATPIATSRAIALTIALGG